MDQQNNGQTKELPKRPFSKLIIFVTIIITALVFGSSAFLLQELRFAKTINQLRNQISTLNQEIITFKSQVNNGPYVSPYQKEKIVGNYEWNSPLDKSKYENALWNKITTARLLGFNPNTGIVEKSTEQCKGQDVNALRKEGGMCVTAYWLEIKTGLVVKKIDTFEKLKTTFFPIENEAEAVSYLMAINSNLEIADDIPEGHTLPIDNGYLVQLVYRNTFGCGSHLPTGVIFKVTKGGEVERLASEKEKPLATGESALCVD